MAVEVSDTICHHNEKLYSIWVFYDRAYMTHFCKIIWQFLSYTEQKNFVKKCPQWGLNSQPPDHQSHALPTELAKNLLEISEVSFLLFRAPLHMLDLAYF